jgi:glycosyltransferase involved in cell wall biosynthesis
VHDVQDEHTSEDLNEMVEKLQNSRITLKEGIFGNPGSTRNYGKKFSLGKYIIFTDSDDVLLIENVIESLMIHSESDILIGGYQSINSRSNKLIKSFEPPKNLIQLAQSPGLWRFVFRRELVQSIDFPPLSMGEDQQFLASIDIFQHNIRLIDKNFYMYFLNNPDQLTSQQNKLQDLTYVVKHLELLGVKSKGKQRTFLMLLIFKNIYTLSRNSKSLPFEKESESKKTSLKYLVRLCLKTNLRLAFRSLGKKT